MRKPTRTAPAPDRKKVPRTGSISAFYDHGGSIDDLRHKLKAGWTRVALARHFQVPVSTIERMKLKADRCDRQDAIRAKANDVAAETSIADLGLSVRAENALMKYGSIRTVGELIANSERDLLRRKHVGRKVLIEIRQALDAIGLCLAPTVLRVVERQQHRVAWVGVLSDETFARLTRAATKCGLLLHDWIAEALDRQAKAQLRRGAP